METFCFIFLFNAIDKIVLKYLFWADKVRRKIKLDKMRNSSSPDIFMATTQFAFAALAETFNSLL